LKWLRIGSVSPKDAQARVICIAVVTGAGLRELCASYARGFSFSHAEHGRRLRHILFQLGLTTDCTWICRVLYVGSVDNVWFN
jgi:hypothetical protein